MGGTDEEATAEARRLLRAQGFEKLAADFADEAATALKAARTLLATRPDNAPPEAEGRN